MRYSATCSCEGIGIGARIATAIAEMKTPASGIPETTMFANFPGVRSKPFGERSESAKACSTRITASVSLEEISEF